MKAWDFFLEKQSFLEGTDFCEDSKLYWKSLSNLVGASASFWTDKIMQERQNFLVAVEVAHRGRQKLMEDRN